METLHYTTHPSDIGKLLLVAGHRGLRYVTLLEDESAEDHIARRFGGSAQFVATPGFFATTTQAIDDYLAHGASLSLPVDVQGGTPLQRSVWFAIARVPHGETISYSDLAERVGFPRAVRAVASACGANPVALAIPCHRVVGKDGGLGGYSMGGTHIKVHLLELESGKREQFAAA